MKQGSRMGMFARLFAMLAISAMHGTEIKGNQMHHGVTGKLAGRDGFAHDFRKVHPQKIRARRGIA